MDNPILGDLVLRYDKSMLTPVASKDYGSVQSVSVMPGGLSFEILFDDQTTMVASPREDTSPALLWMSIDGFHMFEKIKNRIEENIQRAKNA